MIFHNNFDEHFDDELRDFELTLKKLNERYPERLLHVPHRIEEIKDILVQANTLNQNSFAQLLLSQHLDEEHFFANKSDVEIYQHLRYLPAYWHTHKFIEIICVLQGSCINHIMKQKIEMKSGDICIIAPDTQHAVSAFSDDCLIFNYILRSSTFETAFFGVLNENDILSDFFMRTLYHRSSHPYLLFRTGTDPELLNYIGSSYQEFSRNRQYKNRMLSSILNVFFIILLRNHGSDVIFPESNSRQEDENTILLLKYIQEHYSTITLSELSAFFNYSERQIQRIIKNSTGISFSQNIQKLKLREAARLVRSKNVSIAAISEKLGYSAPENFRHAFKNYYGMTPAKYRSSHSNESG